MNVKGSGMVMNIDNVISASMKTLLLYSDETMFIKDMNFIYLAASQGFAELVGLSDPSQLIGKSDFDIFVNKELAKRYHADDISLLKKGEPLINYVEPIPSADGESRYSSTSKYIIRNEDNEPIGLLGVSKDITREYESKLNYEKELCYLFELPKNAFFAVLFDITSWRVVDFRVRDEHNEVVSRYHTIESFMENAIQSVAYDQEIKEFLIGFTQKRINEIFSSGKRSIIIEYERYIGDKDIKWVEEEFHFLIDPVSGHRSVLIIVRDIDNERRIQNEIIQAAQLDGLTGLDNRNTVIKKIQDLVKNNKDSVQALFMIDIDNFKYINDHFGHQNGDEILIKIASIISSCFSNDDCVGRIGGDEFFAYLQVITIEDIYVKAEMLINALQYIGFVKNEKFKLTCSIGISIQDDNKSFETLYAEADSSLYNAKSLGKNQYSIYGLSYQQKIQENLLKNELLIESYHKITNRLIELDYEFIALIDVATQKIVRCDMSGNHRSQGLQVGSDYQKQLQAYISTYFIQKENSENLRIMSFPYVLFQLRKNEKYTTSFVVKEVDRTISYNEWHFLWLDKKQQQILLTSNNMKKMVEIERDTLTGLYNRHTFCHYVREKINLNKNENYLLVRWDIDYFRIYNDTFGIEAGDQLLHDIGLYILTHGHPEGIFGHIQADHFVAFIPERNSHIELWDVLIDKTLKKNTQGSKISFSVGVYRVIDKTIDVSLMCDRALLALRSIKDAYQKRIAFYDESMRDEMLKEQAMIDDFELAIDKEQFLVYFQPQVDYETNSLIGAEALVRWNHPKYGLVMPNQFIPLFEKKGYILKLDEYVWEKSCKYLRSWLDIGLVDDTFSVSVNISRIDIYSLQLLKKIEYLLKKYRLEKAAFRLEITESAYMDTPQQLIEMVEQLQDAQFIIEMDDFGAGYSSLNILKDVPVDILKLDTLFLSKANKNARSGSILSSIIRMADWLQIPIIAEGVETKETADYLKSLGCVYMQGYYFSRPVPAHEFEIILAQSHIKEMDLEKDMNNFGKIDFWNVGTQESLLFNYLIEATAIIEYDSQGVQVIKANDKFYRELQANRHDYQTFKLNILKRFDDTNRKKYEDMLNLAIESGEDVEQQIQSLPYFGEDNGIWTTNTVRLLTKNGNRYIFYLSIKNISKYMM